MLLLNPRNKDFLIENSEYIDHKKTIIAISKSDLILNRENNSFNGHEILYVSSSTGEGIDALKSKIVDVALKK